MPKYDASRYDPPAPTALVTLRNPINGSLQPNISLLLDTGADITLLPQAAVQNLGVTPVVGVAYELVGFDGNKSSVQAVELDMIFLNKAFRGRYLLTQDDHGVLGRDVLASVVLLLNGPKQEWLEQRGGTRKYQINPESYAKYWLVLVAPVVQLVEGISVVPIYQKSIPAGIRRKRRQNLRKA